MRTLRDLGEHRIVDELIYPRFSNRPNVIAGIGDDCAVLAAPNPDEVLVLTTDPCPTPVICLLGEEDLYHYGRMTVLINISDLAAMGARPLGLLISTIMPEDMSTRDYERFLDGAADASSEWSCPVVGGNIKDGPSFTATGTALGAVERDCVMMRTGAKHGDRVLIVGEMGLFWAAILHRMDPSIRVDPSYAELLYQAAYRPVARLNEGRSLAKSKLVTSCMDSSDGVIGCLRELSAKNSADVVLSSPLLNPHPAVAAAASAAGIDARKLMLSWGDWQLVLTCAPEHVSNVLSLLQGAGTTCREIGQMVEGRGRVLLEEDGTRKLVTNFASERFSPTSFFTHGLDAYVAFLRNEPLTVCA